VVLPRRKHLAPTQARRCTCSMSSTEQGPQFCTALLYSVVRSRPSKSPQIIRVVCSFLVLFFERFVWFASPVLESRPPVPRSPPPHQSRPRRPSEPFPACSLAGTAAQLIRSDRITASRRHRYQAQKFTRTDGLRRPGTTELVREGTTWWILQCKRKTCQLSHVCCNSTYLSVLVNF
jgi:hypothetical protein